MEGFPGVPAFAGKLIPLNEVRDLYRRVQGYPGGFRLERLLQEMRITLRIEPADVARIPPNNAVVVVANHPFGVLDGAILAVLLARVRLDVKVLTNSLLEDVPELQRHCIFVDPFDADPAGNRRALRQSLAWLKQSGMLALFPAGEVSCLKFPEAQVADPVWSDTAVRLIRKTGASALPVYFCGHNSIGFHLLGMINPQLRTAFLLHEFLQQEGKEIEIRVGSALSAEAISAIANDSEATENLRCRTYLLGQRGRTDVSWPTTMRSKLTFKKEETIAEAAAPELLCEELERLPEERCLAENGDFSVYLLRASEGPQLLLEVARLREITFRSAGEGTGKERDLDRFDDYYWHLLLWSKKTRELVGAYRAGSTAEILAQHGVKGLYTNTLFRYDPRFFEKIGAALELGRSFVRPEFQRQYAPLLLLWKGIARMVALHPQSPVLIGAVSISNDYSAASRDMIYRFFERRITEDGDELANMIQPRRPFRPNRLRRWDCRAMCNALSDLEELSQPITDAESDGKGLPILLRQYAKIGGKLLGFNVDQTFSDVLDGLVVVDLRKTDPAVLERYMGHNGVAQFRRYHGLDSTPKAGQPHS
jgi:putative hemolysin